MARSFFTPRWIITTLLVVAAVVVMARLGMWQLDRLEQRREFNARVSAQIDAPPVDLNREIPTGLEGMEYRQVVVRGTYVPSAEVILRNQVREGLPGYHLLTPLRIDGSGDLVMVDRGYISMEEGSPEARARYAAPGQVEVRGVIQQAQNRRVFGAPDPTLAPGQTRLDAWNAVNLERIAGQVDAPLLPVYILAAPDPAQPGPPYTDPAPQPDLSEGPHLGYAAQWFTFAAILGIGYPFFVRKQLTGREKQNRGIQTNESTDDSPLHA